MNLTEIERDVLDAIAELQPATVSELVDALTALHERSEIIVTVAGVNTKGYAKRDSERRTYELTGKGKAKLAVAGSEKVKLLLAPLIQPEPEPSMREMAAKGWLKPAPFSAGDTEPDPDADPEPLPKLLYTHMSNEQLIALHVKYRGECEKIANVLRGRLQELINDLERSK